jgi:hypothetical protein
LLGNVTLAATWTRTTDAVRLRVEAPDVRLDEERLDKAAALVPKLSEHARGLQAKAAVLAEIDVRPREPRPIRYDVRMTLCEGQLDHPLIPFHVADLNGSIRCLDGLMTLERLTGQVGEARLELRGWARPRDDVGTPGVELTQVEQVTPEPGSLTPTDADFEGELTIERLQVTRELLEKLPGEFACIETDYAPRGPINVHYQFRRHDGQWIRHGRFTPLRMHANCARFPYPLHGVSGVIEQEIDTARRVRVVRVDLTGFAGKTEVFARGEITGDCPRPAVELKIWANDLPIDETLHAALPTSHQALARSFHPRGLLDFEALVSKPAESDACANRFLIRFHDAALRYDVFPYPVENVNGVLDIRPDRWEFHGFRGMHQGGEFRARGKSEPVAGGSRWVVEITGTNTNLDDEMEAALCPDLRQIWRAYAPTGRMDFVAVVEERPGRPLDVDVTMRPKGCSVRPSFFPYALDDLRGVIRYANNWVLLDKVTARHGASVLSVDEAKAYLKPEGGAWVDMVYLRGSPLVVDDALLQAVPPAIADGVRALGVGGPWRMQTRLTVDAPPPHKDQLPIIFWDGEVEATNQRLKAGVEITGLTGQAACRGRYDGKKIEGLVGNLAFREARVFGQPLQDIRGPVEIEKERPDVLLFPALRARLFDGEIYGPVRVELGPTPRYEMNWTASQIRLEEFGKHNLPGAGQLSGLASARVYLQGEGADLRQLSGKGTIDVPQGQIYQLPLLLDLLKFLGLRMPDGTAFEEAHASFSIRGERVEVRRLDLFGNSISLRGQGELNLDGTDLNLDFYAVWARIVQILPPLVKEMPPALSKHLLKIKMRGRIGDVKLTKEPVPVLVEPVKELVERIRAKRS